MLKSHEVALVLLYIDISIQYTVWKAYQKRKMIVSLREEKNGKMIERIYPLMVYHIIIRI